MAVSRNATTKALAVITLAGSAGIMATGSAGAVSGSAAPAATSIVTRPADCDLPLGDADADEADGALVVLVDGTMSSVDQDGRVDELLRTLDATTADRELAVSVGSFGGSDAEVRYSPCLDGAVFVPDGNNARTRERNRPDLIEGLAGALTTIAAGYESSDPTSAMRAGVDRLAQGDADKPRVLLIHTDGIPTTGCAALPEEVNLDEPGLVDSLLEACTSAGQLPSADGVDVVIGGIGRTDTDLSAEAVTFLIELNTALCNATGATCSVDPNLPPDIWPDTDNDD